MERIEVINVGDTAVNLTKKVNSAFIECIRSFAEGEIVQQLSDEDFFVANHGVYDINYEHPIFSDEYFQAAWSIKLLGKEFLMNYLGNVGDSEELFKHIRRNMAVQLIFNLEESLYGVDVDVISAIAGERYESAEGKGLAISFLPYPLDVKWFEEHAREGTVTFASEARTRFCYNNVHNLRKQLNMTDGGSLAVCYLKGEEAPSGQPQGLYSIGIIPAEEMTAFPYIYFSGYAEWSYCVPVEYKDRLNQDPDANKRGDKDSGVKALSTARCRLNYRNGKMLVPKIDLTKYYLRILENKKVSAADSERVIKLIEKAKK